MLPESGSAWRLRSKLRRGCGCCAPDDDDDDEEEGRRGFGGGGDITNGGRIDNRDWQTAKAPSDARKEPEKAVDLLSTPGGFAMMGGNKPRRRRVVAAPTVSS